MSSTVKEDLEELGPSELGTKEHWENTYKEELQNFINHGSLSESWFGEDIESKIVRFVDSCDEISKESSIVDVGCGNGLMLLQLARKAFINLTGIDYSTDAIDLASRLLESQNFQSVILEVLDLLCDKDQLEKEKYNVCLDKGTYDAVSLLNMETNSSDGDDQFVPREKYLRNIHHILLENGLFILTSCNWTANELASQTTTLFKLVKVVPTPMFKFGGKLGNLVSIVVLRKL